MKRQNRQERSDGRQQPSFRRWGSIKSVGRIVKNENGLAEVGLEPVLCANSKVGFSFGFCRQCFVVLMDNGRRSSSLTRHIALIACLCVEV